MESPLVSPLPINQRAEVARPSGLDVAAVIKQRHSLTELLQDFVFFTPAVLYHASRIKQDFLQDFHWVYPGDQQEMPFVINTGRKLFELPTKPTIVNYNLATCLLGIVKHRWELVKNMIGGICVADPTTGYSERFCYYDLLIYDPDLATKAILTAEPTLKITCFAVSTSEGSYCLEPGSLTALPRFTFKKYMPVIDESADKASKSRIDLNG